MKLYLDDFDIDYARGMEYLYAVSDGFANFSQALGIPRANYNIPTAQVSWDRVDKKILFEINPDFIHDFEDSEIGAVIAHETYHVVLKHLEDLLSSEYSDKNVLIDAQECIINDGLFHNVGVKLPDGFGFFYGTERYNKDFSLFSTRQGYNYIMDLMEESDDNSSNEGDQSSDDNSSNEGDQSSDDDSSSQDGHGCSGVVVDGSDLDDFNKAVKNIIDDVLDNDENSLDDLSDSFKDILSEITDKMDPNSYGVSSIEAFDTASDIDNMNFNWFKLLSTINPKLKTAGKRKVKDTWSRPHRKLVSVYPKVILPDVDRKPEKNSKGDSLPTIIVGLDLSYSIPRHLVSKLLYLVDSVPDEFFKPIPVTWSNTVVEYDKGTKTIVAPGGTNIDALYNYALDYEAKNRIRPYVLVITDGGCNFNDTYFMYTNKRNNVDKDYVNKYWFWAAIQDDDIQAINYNFTNRGYTVRERIHKLSDFVS